MIVGRRAAVEAARAHPLARAVRIDKLSLAALEATLALYRDPELARRELPVLAMLDDPRGRAPSGAPDRWPDQTGGEIVPGVARVGGGALPLLELPDRRWRLTPDPPARRTGARAAVRRAGGAGADPRGHVLLDPRTLADEELPIVAGAVRAALADPRRSGADGASTAAAR